MSENSIFLKMPVLANPDIFRNPNRTILTADSQTLLSYDPATGSGFIYMIEEQRWTIMAPISFSAFANIIELSGFKIANSDDAKKWLAACMCHAPMQSGSIN